VSPNERRLAELLVRIALVAALVVAIGYALGFKAVWAFSERSCPPDHVVHYPIGTVMAGRWLCVPVDVTPPPGDMAWWSSLPTGYREQRVSVYLANLRFRVFTYDNASGSPHFFGFNVPAPSY
jgi:hypothetical protein